MRPERTGPTWLIVLAAGMILGACRSATEAPMANELIVRLERSAADTVPGNYRSVLDTAILTVSTTTEVPVDSFKVQLARQDTEARFSVTLTPGPVVLDARIVSNNGTDLFFGSQPVDWQPGTDSVVISVAPTSPVLLVSLDYSTIDIRTQRRFSTLVYNRGKGPLYWSISDTLPPSCRTNNSFCIITPMQDTLPEGAARTLTITVPTTTAQPPAIVLRSSEGSVRFP